MARRLLTPGAIGFGEVPVHVDVTLGEARYGVPRIVTRRPWQRRLHGREEVEDNPGHDDDVVETE